MCCWERFTIASVKLDEKINERSLVNIPTRYWQLFTICTYSHFFLAVLLFVCGCVCFCLGMQFSVMYQEVNCSDGTNIWIPLLNLIASFTGLFTIRTVHFHWPAFVLCVALSLIVPFNLIVSIDLAVAAGRWMGYAEDPYTASVGTWAFNYAYMDIGLAFVAMLNNVACLILLAILIKFWCRHPRTLPFNNSPSSSTISAS